MCRPASAFLFFRAELQCSGDYSAHHNAPYKKTSLTHLLWLMLLILRRPADFFLPAPTPPSPPLSKKKKKSRKLLPSRGAKEESWRFMGCAQEDFFLTRRKECRGRTPGQRRRRDRKRARKRKGIVGGGGHSGERPLRPRPNVFFGGGAYEKKAPLPFPFFWTSGQGTTRGKKKASS